MAYRFDGKPKQLAFGAYPTISLKDARERCEAARKLLAHGIDPSANKKANKDAYGEQSANSFEVVAREWIKNKESTWAASHTNKILRRLEMYVFPCFGSMRIADVKATDVLQAARRVEEKGAIESAHRVKQNCGQVFSYAIATGRAERNPVPDIKGALKTAKPGHMAAVTEPLKVGELLRALDGFEGTLIVRCALRLAPLVFVRPGELRKALWADVDLDAAEWRFTASKTGAAHIVPLSRQAVAALRDIHPFTSRSKYVFHSLLSRERPMSDNAILSAMCRMGIAKEEMSGHGFRAMARTILDEVMGFRPDIIEHQLAHAVRDPNGRAYNRTAHLPEPVESSSSITVGKYQEKPDEVFIFFRFNWAQFERVPVFSTPQIHQNLSLRHLPLSTSPFRSPLIAFDDQPGTTQVGEAQNYPLKTSINRSPQRKRSWQPSFATRPSQTLGMHQWCPWSATAALSSSMPVTAAPRTC